MMNSEILEIAVKADPETMLKTAQALELIEKIAPEFLPEVFEDFETISSVTEENVKTAAAVLPNLPGLKNFYKGVETAIGVAAVVGTGIAASLGTHIAADLFDSAKRGLTKSRNFKRIMDNNPHLKNDLRDKSRIKPAYDALHRFAPDFTADPMVGGSLLMSMVNQPPGNEYQLIEKLIGSRKNLLDVKDKQLRPDWKGARDLINKAKSQKGEPGE